VRYLVLIVALAACGAPSSPPAQPAAKLNLGFDAVTAGKPDVWSPGIGFGDQGQGYDIALDRNARGGASSLRLHAGTGGFGSTFVTTDATPLRGKRVRLHAWVKTDGVAAPGWAGVWLRSGGGGSEQAFDNMTGRGIVDDTGAAGWRQATAQIDVPAGATELFLGPLLVGAGTAWFDELRLEVVPIPVPKAITIAGVVVDPDGKPAAGAVVTLMAATGSAVSHVIADQDGRFTVAARTGAWGMSAHHPNGVGAFFNPRDFTDDTSDVRLALGTDGVIARGRLSIDGLVPAGTTVEIAPFSNNTTDGFVVPVGTDGRFQARLPRGDSYYAKAKGPGLIGQAIQTRKGDEVVFEVAITELKPAPADVNAWVAASAVPLTSAEAGHGFDDMKPIGAMIGKARIVALGEATHGTREFFQLKHRFLEYLVAEHGFTLFIIEANLTESRAINDYVLHGKGDPRAALAGIYFWTWNTEEVLAMIEWMRAWNADPAHKKKLQFAGDDMQVSVVAHASVRAFLDKVAPSEAAALMAPLAPFDDQMIEQTFSSRPAEQQQAVVAAVAALAKRFDRSRAAWSKVAGKEPYLDARDDLRLLAQLAAKASQPDKSFELRDRAMADNVDAILARHPRGTRAVLWAHNGHVAYEYGAVENQGSHLRARHGKDYVVFGFAFGEGAFQAWDFQSSQGGLKEYKLGPPPAWDVSAPFRATGKPLVVVDLRNAPRGVVADWFAAPHPMRETGAGFGDEESMSGPQVLSRRFDAVIYVDKTTRARPVTPSAR
jgi:erythromycin esterase